MDREHEMRMTKEDWDFTFTLMNLDISGEMKEQILCERMLPRIKAVMESDELLECEREENLMTFSEYMKLLSDRVK